MRWRLTEKEDLNLQEIFMSDKNTDEGESASNALVSRRLVDVLDGNRILVKMPGCEYVIDKDTANRLARGLDAALITVGG